MDKSKERSHLTKSLIDIFAGTIAGINVTLVGHPFDTLKIRLQTQPQDKKIYNGLIDCFQKTIKWEGFGGLYKGVSSPIIGQMFFRATMFISYGEAKRYILKTKPKLEYRDYFIAGSFGWSIATVVECPIDFFKTQTQIQIIKTKGNPEYVPLFKTPVECFNYVMKINGFLGAYQGFVPHLIRNTFAGSLHIGLFEYCRIQFAKKHNCEVKNIPLTNTLVSGAIGGWFYWFIFFPIDVIKSSLQSDNPDKSKRRYKGAIDAYHILMKEGGIKRFYTGFTPCMMRAIPANAVLLATSSFLSEWL